MSRALLTLTGIVLPLLATGCATTAPPGVESPLTGFSTVAERTRSVTGKGVVWAQSAAEAQALATRTAGLVRKKTVSADTAVEVALLNNKGLQAAYAEIGLSGAELWQESLPVNPTLSIGVTGISPVRTIESAVVGNILSAITRPRRVAVAETRFRQAQLRAAEATLRLAAETRRAWVEAVAARERISYLGQAQVAADAASDLAQKLGETGAYTKGEQAREHAFFAELTGDVAEARLDARRSKETLTRLMGLWGRDVDFTVPAVLPKIPAQTRTKRAIEAEALRNRVDLDIAKLELDALARSYGLTQATRYVSDLQLLAGLEVEREKEEAEEEGGKETTKTEVSPVVDLEFTIPVFDTGQARLRTAEMSYLRAANLVAERAVNVRSEAREAYDTYRSRHEIARHYRNNVVPLRQKIEEQSVLTYNGMITSTFVLLADTRDKLNGILLSLNAKRNFWLADVALTTAIYGGGGEAGGEDEANVEMAAASGGDED